MPSASARAAGHPGCAVTTATPTALCSKAREARRLTIFRRDSTLDPSPPASDLDSVDLAGSDRPLGIEDQAARTATAATASSATSYHQDIDSGVGRGSAY